MAEDIKQKIALLANGQGTKIVDHMRETINDLHAILQTFPAYAAALEPVVHEVTISIKQTIAFADKFATPLNILEIEIQRIESRPMVRRYHELQSRLNDPATPTVDLSKTRSEMHQIKSAVSPELSKLVSKSQQSLSHRLNLLQCWKSVNKMEIRVLEELLDRSLGKILEEAEKGGETELAENIREKIAFLKQQSDVKMSKIEKSMLQVGNLKFLKDALTHQLIEVVRIEDQIQSKYQTLQAISQVAADLEKGLPKDKVSEIIQAGKRPQPSAFAPAPPPVSRMAFKDQRR